MLEHRSHHPEFDLNRNTERKVATKEHRVRPKRVLIILGSTGLLLLILLTVHSGRGAQVSPIGTNQKMLVVCVKYTDATTTRMANCSDWVTTLTSELNTFYNQATFNQTNFTFQTVSGAGAPANGWFDLGYASSSYDFFKTSQDAINLADPFADFNQFNRVLVITNWAGFGGQGGGPWDWRVDEGVEHTDVINGVPTGVRVMTMSVVNEWLANSFGNAFDEGGSVMGHEIGHQLGAPTHYGDVHFFPGLTRDVITPWDIMGLSPTLNHFLGWPKSQIGWIPTGPRIQMIGPPVGSDIDTTVLLNPLEQSSTGVQAIRIPITPGSPFIGYMVENRRQINGDQGLPSQGVLVTAIDEDPSEILKAIVMDNPASPGDLNNAPFGVGQSFQDAARNLTVTVVSQTGNNYNVRVQYRLPPSSKPDPAITPWGAPPYESPDIWVDSEKNGWNTYRYTDGAGNPVGNGDDAWINHANRVYARIHNLGPGVATNVRVQVFVNDPPGMGDAGPNWIYLGTIIFPSIAGGGATAQDFVLWTPTVAAHTCIKAVIENTSGELTTANNLAQENVTAFDTSAGSPYRAITLKATVNNPFPNSKTPVFFHVRDVPRGWAVSLEPRELVLPPGGRDSVVVSIYPSGIPPKDGSYDRERNKVPDCCAPKDMPYDREKYRPGFIGKPKLEALVPYADTYIPIGGIDVWTHLVKPARLTCQLGPRAHPTEHAEQAEQIGDRGSPADLQSSAMPGVQVRKGKVEQKTEPKVLDPERIFEMGSIVKRPIKLPQFPLGGQLEVSGYLTPVTPGAIVAVELTTAKGRQFRLVKTSDNGEYRAVFRSMRPGRWVAQAFFSGDSVLSAADSDSCEFIVGKAR